MSANELHGTGESSRTVHAACGTDFPSCGGEFLPFGKSRALDIHLTHRMFVYVASALVLALVLTMLFQARRAGHSSPGRRLRSGALIVLAMLVVQVMLGAINVWAGEHAWLVIAHLAAATLLWSSLVYVSLLVMLAPSGEWARVSRDATVEAVPA
jgi:heme A synthase